MSTSLIEKGARGGGLVILGSVSTALIQILSLVILSRLLTPADFGLIAMVSVFVTLGNLIRDFGMPTAALQAKELTIQQASNLFWMNLGLAAFAGLALASCAPLIVMLFGEPRLAAIVPVMALVVVMNGAGAQHQVYLARKMRYGALVLTDVAAQLAALLGAIILALVGLGYWALVAQSMILAGVLLLGRWFASRWVPVRYRRGHGSAGMFRYGVEYGLANLLTFFQSNADSVIIGMRMDALSLGLYNRAYQLSSSPALFLAPLARVVVPTLNATRAEGKPYEPLLLRVQFVLCIGIIWVFAMAAGTANGLIPLVLGEGWTPSISIFQILAVASCFMVLSTVSYWAFILNEQSRELLKYNLISKPLVVVCLLIGSLYGLLGVAIGYAIGMGLSWPMNLFWLAKVSKLPAWKFLKNGCFILLYGLVGGLSSGVGSNLISADAPVIGRIAIGVALGTTAYLLSILAVPSSRRQLLESGKLFILVLRRER